jgi:hypothetical protein
MRAVKKTAVVLSVLTALTAAIACSSSSSKGTGGSGDDAGDGGNVGVDVTIDVINNPNNCVKPGTANNSQGVGGYCNPGGGQCDKAGPGGSPTLCTGDYSSTMNAWFCTIPCPASCGAGASCVTTAMGSTCVPAACVAFLGDAAILDEGGANEAGPGDSSTTDSPASDGPVTDGASGDGAAGDSAVSDGSTGG